MKDETIPTFLTRKQLTFESGVRFGIDIETQCFDALTAIIRGLTKEGPFEYKANVVSDTIGQTFSFRIFLQL